MQTSQPLSLPIQVATALAAGTALRFVVGLHPVWQLTWLAPAALLWLAYRSNRRDACWSVALAALIGVSANFPYFHLVMPLPAAIGVTLALAALWTGAVLMARRLVLRYQHWWTVLVYPVAWTAFDTLMAAFLPDGNFSSLAYSQCELLPLMQMASLCGVPGIVFLVSLLPSALAFAASRGLRAALPPLCMSAALLAAALAFGQARLQQAAPSATLAIGLVAIDDAIGPKASAPYVSAIWAQYDRHVAALAAQGARIVLLPEKIAVLTPAQQQQWQQHLRALAAAHHIWLVAGVGTDTDGKRLNLAWMFAPDGTLAANYQKQHVAPPEREFIRGDQFALREVEGFAAGLAICKDMHFASLGRGYALRQARVMLVPAWDFELDAWYAAHLSAVRGIEGGYAVVRAARDGLLTVSDAQGRFLAQADSAGMPGAALLARLPLAPAAPTLYSRIGDLVGWLCVGAAALMLGMGRGCARARARLPAQPRQAA
ncbi:MAG: nitrilase-related carbon-nitrogen hydrolase [Pseudomonadota bacterium]